MKLTIFKLRHLSLLSQRDIDKLSNEYDNLTDEEREEVSRMVNLSYYTLLGKSERRDYDRINKEKTFTILGKKFYSLIGAIGLGMFFIPTLLASSNILQFSSIMAFLAIEGLGVGCLATLCATSDGDSMINISIPKHPIGKMQAARDDENFEKAKMLKAITDCKL